MEIVFNIILLLVAAFFGGGVAYILRLPLVVGYIVGGIILSFIFGHNLSDSGIIEGIANIGVVLLMFTLGLEFNLSRLKGLGEVILVGSLMQIFLTIIFGVLFFPVLGFGLYNSLFLGAVLSLSSTAVVVKILSDRGELESLPGEIAVGWLLIQDLFTLPLIVILPALGLTLSWDAGFFWTLLTVLKALSFSLIIIAIIYILGRYLIPFLFQKLSEIGVREILLVSVILFCFVLSFGAGLLGISFAIGAFLSGLILSYTTANQAIFAEIRPLRDIFSVVFFVSLGFLVKPTFLLNNLSLVLILTFLVLIFKFGVSSLMVFILGYHSRVAFRVGISLTSVGEFAFVIALLAQAQNIINDNTYMTILSVATLSLIISSPLLSYSETLYKYFSKFIKKRLAVVANFFLMGDRNLIAEEKMYVGHVVILGHGRVGSYIANALLALSIPFVVVDYNMRLVKRLRQINREAIYGDPGDLEVLRATNLPRAQALVVAIPNREVRSMIIANANTLNKDIKIYCRIHKDEEKELTMDANISFIQPEFEAALEITRRLLTNLGIDHSMIKKMVLELEKEHGY